MKHLFFFCSLLLLAACSGGGKSSAQLKISGNFIFGGANLANFVDGGLMVWGQGPNGQAFGRALVGTDTLSLDLPNGTWTFYAMAWDQTTGNFTGTARCAQSVSLLKGEPVTANLTLTNQNCAQAVFGGTIHNSTGANSSVTLAPTKFEWCGSEPSQVTAPNHRCSDQPSLDTKATKGHGTSYRLRLRSYDRRPGAAAVFLPGEILSQCFDGTGSPATPDNGEVAMMAPGLPTGQGNTTPFHISMEVFVGSTNCDATAGANNRGFVPVELPHGLQSQQPRLKYVVDTTMAPAKHKLYVQISDADICNGREAQMPFAAGLGTASRQFLICSARQLQKMVTGPMNGHYKLLKDIDLNPLSKGALSAPTTAQEPFYSCLDIGGNFFPIGHMIEGCGVNTPTPFTGSLNGNGKKITGLRTRLDNIDFMGMFAMISGGGAVRNITLDSPEVEGRSSVGSLAGHVYNNNGATFEKISVLKPDVEGRDPDSFCMYTGGVFGFLSASNLQEVSVSKGRVGGDCSKIGGIAGQATLSMSNFVFFTGKIDSYFDMTGGIFGETYDVNLSYSRTEGYIYGQNYVGGLVGNSANSRYNFVYSHAGVEGFSGATGGLFGAHAGNTGSHTVTNAYFSGIVDFQSSGGEIAGIISGVAASDFVNVYFQNYGFSAVNPNGGVLGFAKTREQFYNADATITFEPGFNKISGDLPRFNAEVPFHPCRQNNAFASLSVQQGLGRGSVTNPILICNPTQLSQIASNLSLHYRFEGLVDSPIITSSWGNLTGSIDGNGYALLALDIRSTTDGFVSWFSQVSGTIKNLVFFGTRVEDSGISGTTSSIAKTLSGTIDNVRMYKTVMSTGKSGGAMFDVITSSGRVRNSYLDANVFMPGNFFGGIAKSNAGVIEQSRINVHFNSTPTTMNYVAGLVVDNTGIIRRIRAEVDFDDGGAIGSSNLSLGVINNLAPGLMEDVGFEHSNLILNGENFFGLASLNTGIIRRIFMKTSIGTSSIASTFSQTVGPGSEALTDVFYLRPAYVVSPTVMSNQVISSTIVNATTCNISLDFPETDSLWLTRLNLAANEFMIAAEDNNRFYRVQAYNIGTSQATVTSSTGCSDLLNGAIVNLVYSPPTSGTLITETQAQDYLTYSSWNGQVNSSGTPTWVANLDNPSDRSRLVAIYLAYLSGQPLPEPPPTWEFNGGEELNLFLLDNN